MVQRLSELLVVLAILTVCMACGSTNSEPASSVRRQLSESDAVLLVAESICGTDTALSSLRAVYLVDVWIVTGNGVLDQIRFTVVDSTGEVLPDNQFSEDLLSDDASSLPRCPATPTQLPSIFPDLLTPSQPTVVP